MRRLVCKKGYIFTIIGKKSYRRIRISKLISSFEGPCENSVLVSVFLHLFEHETCEFLEIWIVG